MGSSRVLAVRLFGPAVLALAIAAGSVAPASAAPRAVPVPVQRLAEAAGHDLVPTPARTGERHAALAVPGDDETYLGLAPGCATGKGKAKPNAVVFTSTKVKLDYVLTGTALRKTGTVKTKVDRPVSIKLPSVRAGSYRLTLALHKKTDLVADETFDVLPCVVVKATCRAVTFTNPAGNPAAYGVYSGHKKDQDFELDLAPGESRTVRADYSKIDYDFSSDESGLGHGTVKVKQSCAHGPATPADHALQSFGFVGCASPGALAPVQLAWSVQPSVKKPRYEVLDAQQQIVAEGSAKGGRGKELTLAAGSYTYRSYANRLTSPFEDLSFVVLDCVQVTPRCRAIELRNPNAVAVVVAAEPSGDAESEDAGSEDAGSDEDYVDPVVVGAGETVTVPWHSTGAYVVAYLDDESLSPSSFLSLASPEPWDEDLPEITVPQDC